MKNYLYTIYFLNKLSHTTISWFPLEQVTRNSKLMRNVIISPRKINRTKRVIKNNDMNNKVTHISDIFLSDVNDWRRYFYVLIGGGVSNSRFESDFLEFNQTRLYFQRSSVYYNDKRQCYSFTRAHSNLKLSVINARINLH